MGMILIYAILIIIFLIILACIIYYVSVKFGYKKFGILTSSLLIIIVLCLIFTNYIDEKLYFKSNAKDDLKIIELTLKDDFEIISNNVIGFPERIQTTILKISQNDKLRIISEIKKGKFFIECKSYRPLYYKMMSKNSKKLIANYSNNNIYFKESFEQKEGYVAISVYIAVKEETNIIELFRIED